MMIGTLIFCAVLASSIGIGAGEADAGSTGGEHPVPRLLPF